MWCSLFTSNCSPSMEAPPESAMRACWTRHWEGRRTCSGMAKPTFFDLAAAYAFGLVKNPPFIDGNKRIGFATAALFLELNGLHLDAPEVEAVLNTLALAAGAMSEVAYATWLKANSQRARAK